MSFRVRCSCGKLFGVQDQYAGKKGKCPHCGAALVLQPSEGDAPAAPKESPKAPAKAPPKGPKAPKAAPKIDPSAVVRALASGEGGENEVVVGGHGAAPRGGGKDDLMPVSAAYRHVVQHFCPVCGTRYKEGEAKCSNCWTPLTGPEAEAAAAAKNKRRIAWLPHLSTKAKYITIAISSVVVLTSLFFVFMYPALKRQTRLQAELNVVQSAMTGDTLLRLSLEMPKFPYHRPATVKATGKWERHQGAAIFPVVGAGTYDLEKRELNLAGDDGGKTYTYQASLPPILCVAAGSENNECLRLMLDEPGCNVNQKDSHGATPLHVAAKADQAASVKLLLEHGADDSIRDEKGLTPLATALSVSSKKAAKVLRTASASDPAKIILLPD